MSYKIGYLVAVALLQSLIAFRVGEGASQWVFLFVVADPAFLCVVSTGPKGIGWGAFGVVLCGALITAAVWFAAGLLPIAPVAVYLAAAAAAGLIFDVTDLWRWLWVDRASLAAVASAALLGWCVPWLLYPSSDPLLSLSLACLFAASALSWAVVCALELALFGRRR